MKFSQDKYRELMEGFVDLMDTINMEVPPEIKPFYELYKQLRDTPEIDESLFEDETILHGLETVDNNCTFKVKTEKLDGLNIELLMFVPALKIKDFQNKMLFSEYKIRMSYEHDEENRVSQETHLILSALTDGGSTTNLLKYICKANRIIIRDEVLEWLVGFNRSVEGNTVLYTKPLEVGTRSDVADEKFVEATKLFERLILELKVGLGVL